MAILTRHRGEMGGGVGDFNLSGSFEVGSLTGASIQRQLLAKGLRVVFRRAWAEHPRRALLPHQPVDLASSSDRILPEETPSAGRLDVTRRDVIGAFREFGVARTVAMLILETEVRGESGEISPGFGIAGTCGGAWEIIPDHGGPTAGREWGFFAPENVRPVFRGANDFDGCIDARHEERQVLRGANHSDPRDGLRIAVGTPRKPKP